AAWGVGQVLGGAHAPTPVRADLTPPTPLSPAQPADGLRCTGSATCRPGWGEGGERRSSPCAPPSPQTGRHHEHRSLETTSQRLGWGEGGRGVRSAGRKAAPRYPSALRLDHPRHEALERRVLAALRRLVDVAEPRGHADPHDAGDVLRVDVERLLDPLVRGALRPGHRLVD